jgi:Wadjet protein JetA
MFFDKINSSLFRPLASPNASVYAMALMALYERMIVNEMDSAECTPGECRVAISTKLIMHNQRVDWSKETDEFAQSDQDEYDEAAQIYRYLRRCGWVREMDEMGYKRIAYMPRIAANLLSALESITSDKPASAGATCQGVYNALQQAKSSPREHASSVIFAADTAVSFCRDLRNISASSREVAHQMVEEIGTARIVTTYFDKFVNGDLLLDYSKLKTTNHPYRFRGQTLSLTVEIKNDHKLMNELVQGLLSGEEVGADPEELREKINKNLDDIYRSFDLIDKLMQRIDHYRRIMTKRCKETMQYSLTAIPDLGKRVDSLIASLDDRTPEEGFCPSLFAIDTGIGPARQYTPRVKQPEAKVTSIETTAPPLEEIAMSRAMDDFYRRRTENPDRIIELLERSFGRQQRITTDDIKIESLDDFLGYLQLRDLAHDAVPISSSYRRLLSSYKVSPVVNEITENEYLVAPKLRIERRGLAPRQEVR